MTAIKRAGSQLSKNSEVTERVIPYQIDTEHRNKTVWVPLSGCYGSGRPLLIGLVSLSVVKGGETSILSFQMCAVDLSTGTSWTTQCIPHGSKGLGLLDLLREAIQEGLVKRLIKKWPTHITAVTHFSLVDLLSLKDFAKLKSKFILMGRYLVSGSSGVSLTIWDKQHHPRKVEVTLRDVALLAPNGKNTLIELGGFADCEAFELDDAEVERLDELLENDPVRFLDYSHRNAEITATYALKILRLNFGVTGKLELPVTLASMGMTHFLNNWSKLNIDQHAVLGTVVDNGVAWSHGQARRKSVVAHVAERHQNEPFATECYHGGRNEQFVFGAGEKGVWTDWDLRGAYPTGMSCIETPIWTELRHSKDLNDFQPNVLGSVRAKFSFPLDTRFPSLPIRTGHGLIFPLQGESYCTAPEIFAARQLGAELEIIDGIIVPTRSGERPFEPFIIECAKYRASFPTGSLEELIWKELVNSIYGKTAQGLEQKRRFDLRSEQQTKMPPSQVTNPFFASFTSGSIRAVLAEILPALPRSRTVFSVTTDGFLTNATEAEVIAATQGPLCRLFAEARQQICGDPTVLQVKHRIAQPLGWRTRGQATLETIEGEKLLLAKAGLKAPMQCKTQQNQWIIDKFKSRTSDSKHKVIVYLSLDEIRREGGKRGTKERDQRLNMDYDFKCEPVNPGMRLIQGDDHLCFETKPWLSVKEFEACRHNWDLFHANQGGVLKTQEDLARFNDYRSVDVERHGLRRAKADTSLVHASRMFLRAYTRSLWGLDYTAMSPADLVQLFTINGFKISKHNVENARRPNAKLVPHTVPRTPAVLKLVGLLELHFPSFESEMLLEERN